MKVGSHFRRVLIAVTAVGLETLRDDPLQLGGPLDAEADASHWPRAGRHLVEHEAERPDVAAVIGGFAERLLG